MNKIIMDYSSGFYGSRPRTVVTKGDFEAGRGDGTYSGGMTDSPGGDETVTPTKTNAISEFTFILIIGLVIFLMWK